MAKPKKPPPTAEQEQYVRDAWSILLYDKARIAKDSGLSMQQVVGLIHAHGWWSQERAKRQKAHDATLAEQGDECTRRQMRAALALAGAHAIGAEKSERAMAAATDEEALRSLRRLPPIREVQIVERVNTGRPTDRPEVTTVQLPLVDALIAAGGKVEVEVEWEAKNQSIEASKQVDKTKSDDHGG